MAATLDTCDGKQIQNKPDRTVTSDVPFNKRITVTHSNELLDIHDSRGSGILINKRNHEPKQTFRMPKSSLLSRVQDFLPKMAAADTELSKAMETVSPETLNIENVENCEGPVVEMNLALVEQSESSDSESEDDDLSLPSDEEDQPIMGSVTEKNMKISQSLGRKQKPFIQVINKDERVDE